MEDDHKVQEMDNVEVGKQKCKGCKESFSMLLLLLHLKKTINCQKAYGKGSYSKLCQLASKPRSDPQIEDKNEVKTKKEKV